MGTTQSKILRALLQAEGPLPVEQLSRHLEISRNGAYQHVVALERDGLIEKAAIAQTRGRPSQTYQLTDSGRAEFPKHYALFSRLLVGLLKSRIGAAELTACLDELGASLAEQFAGRVAGLQGDAAIAEVAQILKELGYEAETAPRPDGEGLEIRAHNCVFHELAREHPEVCRLDLTLLERLIGWPVDHAECVVRGGGCCRFRAASG